MPKLIVDDFLRFCAMLENQRLTTAARHAGFTIAVLPDGLEITPESSGFPRRVSREKIDRVLEQYEQSASLRPVHYHDITFDSSYLMAVISAYLQDRLSRESIATQRPPHA